MIILTFIVPERKVLVVEVEKAVKNVKDIKAIMIYKNNHNWPSRNCE